MVRPASFVRPSRSVQDSNKLLPRTLPLSITVPLGPFALLYLEIFRSKHLAETMFSRATRPFLHGPLGRPSLVGPTAYDAPLARTYAKGRVSLHRPISVHLLRPPFALCCREQLVQGCPASRRKMRASLTSRSPSPASSDRLNPLGTTAQHEDPSEPFPPLQEAIVADVDIIRRLVGDGPCSQTDYSSTSKTATDAFTARKCSGR